MHRPKRPSGCLIPSHLLNHDRSPWFHLETRSNFELIMFPFLYIRSNETGVELSLYVPRGLAYELFPPKHFIQSSARG
jgi:hypothetical protein